MLWWKATHQRNVSELYTKWRGRNVHDRYKHQAINNAHLIKCRHDEKSFSKLAFNSIPWVNSIIIWLPRPNGKLLSSTKVDTVVWCSNGKDQWTLNQWAMTISPRRAFPKNDGYKWVLCNRLMSLFDRSCVANILPIEIRLKTSRYSFFI
jgi:hypothetical protein